MVVGGVMTGVKHGACAAGVSGVDFELHIRAQHRGVEAQKKQMTAVAVTAGHPRGTRRG